MDIRQAKEELRRAFLAYTERTEEGTLCVPTVRQRPLLLMGPPGIGKTAVLYQLAQELHTNLVSYTMTHHTRQSALGLPMIREKTFDGRTYSATEYTMSEILASVYDRMEKTGIRTGILFLDEINCVSETLMPAMLQLLQTKQFGTHRLPEGWIIAAAGNPPAYNESARWFDTATMDRVRLLELSESYPVWRAYAVQKGLHPAVMSYLELNPEHLLCIQAHAHGRSFVTPRAWEDLSAALCSYERLGFPADETLFPEFLQHPQIAASFAAYFRLFAVCRERLPMEKILSGAQAQAVPELRQLRFDERLAAVEFLLHALSGELADYRKDAAYVQSLESFLTALPKEDNQLAAAKEALSRRERAMALRRELGVLPPDEEAGERYFSANVHARLDDADDLSGLQEAYHGQKELLSAAGERFSRHLENAFCFLRDTFGPEHELLIFLTQLEMLPGIPSFLQASGRYHALCAEVLPNAAGES